MARIRKWQETLMLASMALFFSLAQVWPLRAREAESRERAVYSRVISRARGATTVGLEFLPQKPFLRLIRASTVPVEMPLATGAFLAMAGSPSTAAPDPAGAGEGAGAEAANSSCTSDQCHLSGAPCCSISYNNGCCNSCERCYTVVCTQSDQFRTGGFTCYTCGHASCPACA